jgi:hypothetical protein
MAHTLLVSFTKMVSNYLELQINLSSSILLSHILSTLFYAQCPPLQNTF